MIFDDTSNIEHEDPPWHRQSYQRPRWAAPS